MRVAITTGGRACSNTVRHLRGVIERVSGGRLSVSVLDRGVGRTGRVVTFYARGLAGTSHRIRGLLRRGRRSRRWELFLRFGTWRGGLVHCGVGRVS